MFAYGWCRETSDSGNMDHIDGSAHAIPVMSAPLADPDLMGEIISNNKAQDLDLSVEDIGSAEFQLLCRQFVKSREKRKAEKSIEKDPKADAAVPIPEAILAPDPVPLVALSSKVTKRHKEKGNETRAWAPSLGCFPINVSSTSIRSGSSSTSKSSTSSFVVVSETSQGGGSGNRAATLPICEDDAMPSTVSFPKSWPKPPEKNEALDTLDEATLDDTADYRSQDDEADDKKIPQHFDIDKSTDDGPAPDARRSLEKTARCCCCPSEAEGPALQCSLAADRAVNS